MRMAEVVNSAFALIAGKAARHRVDARVLYECARRLRRRREDFRVAPGLPRQQAHSRAMTTAAVYSRRPHPDRARGPEDPSDLQRRSDYQQVRAPRPRPS
jgi:hypothetical protein